MGKISVLLAVTLLCVASFIGCATTPKDERVSLTAEDVGQETPAIEGTMGKKAAAEGVSEGALATGEKGAESVEVTTSIDNKLTRMAEREGRLTPIYFDYDKFFIKNNAKPLLENITKWLKRNRAVKVRIQGHADERGSSEYNLALGQRRANSARDYLITLGVKPSRLSTISYGEEKPANPNHSEAAWAKNRRAEFEIVSR
jgi:peptidoglycan-associated lipoprotein